ncbi:hypothetical protein CCYA_CCYA10G2948 [Cyanidiococcus yangmingshanensis]|nr:hypothetical protein CCYA_CCYA10G2948 [Cyanidiococcus yangmingshanensis]
MFQGGLASGHFPPIIRQKFVTCSRIYGVKVSRKDFCRKKHSSEFSLPASLQAATSLQSELEQCSAETALKPNPSQSFDVAIIGAGPAGLSLAAELAQINSSGELASDSSRISVVLVERDFSQRWLPNYGVWLDEIDHLNIEDCLAAVWPKTTAYLPQKITKDRKYARIDRQKLKQRLIEKCSEENAGVFFLEGIVRQYEPEKKELRISCSNKHGLVSEVSLTSKIVIDTSGHKQALVKFTEPHNPSYQAAYGIEAIVDAHPFPTDEMVLMDYREPFAEAGESPEQLADYEAIPTFLYAMPMSSSRIFLEETSLTARPAVPFEKLRRRLYSRLKSLGIRVLDVLEEEYCLIPMGGALPDFSQSLLGFGGTAGLVHPSTGYMMARTLNMASELASGIYRRSNTAVSDLWRELIWTDARLAQRDFFVFGGEVLLSMSLSELREFFVAFFELRDKMWHDFLSFRQLSGSERLSFGVEVFLRTSNRVRYKLAKKALQNWPLLIKSIVK